MYEELIPEFFAELGRAVEAEGMKYEEFRKTYPEKIAEIAEKYVQVNKPKNHSDKLL